MSSDLTIEQKATNADTSEHIRRVAFWIHTVIKELLDRIDNHDQTKLTSPEVEAFTEFTNKLAACSYGSPEYEGYRKAMGPALKHHYAKNCHHPEFWANGLDDMSLIDILEMLCDWKAATERLNDGNLLKSIDYNADRFSISPQLVKIFKNTAKLFT